MKDGLVDYKTGPCSSFLAVSTGAVGRRNTITKKINGEIV